MKNIIIALLAIYGTAVTLESLGLTDFIDGIGPGYCYNVERKADPKMDGGGTGINETTMTEYLSDAEERIKNQNLNLRYFYLISKAVVEDIFNRDLSATGLMIAPYFDEEDKINLLITRSHSNHVIIESTENDAFIVKTYCPLDCDNSMSTLYTEPTGHE